MDNIAKVAWTIGARQHQGHLLCGYVMHVEGYRGVKGLRASEEQLFPCVKGRFYTQMRSKFEQLATSVTNEVVAVDFADLMCRLTVADACQG